MLWGRFIYGCAEICSWRSSLSIDMVQSDINLKALAICVVFLLILDSDYYAGVRSQLIENGNESHGKKRK